MYCTNRNSSPRDLCKITINSSVVVGFSAWQNDARIKAIVLVQTSALESFQNVNFRLGRNRTAKVSTFLQKSQ